MRMTRSHTSTDVAPAQLERVTALLTVGLVVALEAGTVSTDEANQLLFSPHTMALLRAAGVRQALVDLIHAGTEIEDFESLPPEVRAAALRALRKDALACLASCEPYDFNAEKWMAQLIRAPRPRGSEPRT
jgi:hypothetical protein